MEEMTREQLEEIIGPGAMRDYDDSKEWARPELHAWVAKLRGFTDAELVDEAASAVLDAAIANSHRMWWDSSWCKSSALMHEAKRRHVAAGHDEDCLEDNLYEKGWNRAYRSQNYDPGRPSFCTCGEGDE
jgi:hypothetical protein